MIVPIPALTDNYVYILKTNRCVVAVDPSESEPVLAFLDEAGWRLTHIWNTHHHPDHVGGNLALKSRFGCEIACSLYDLDRTPGASRGLRDGERFMIDDLDIVCLAIPGHTLGHMAFWLPAAESVFVGDTLFSAGCGRLFEGTAAQLHTSLERLANLPGETKIYCGHEYTEKNLRFAKRIEAGNQAIDQAIEETQALRAQNLPTLPVTLAHELDVNPFLRLSSIEIRRGLDMESASNLELFTHLRQLRDGF